MVKGLSRSFQILSFRMLCRGEVPAMFWRGLVGFILALAVCTNVPRLQGQSPRTPHAEAPTNFSLVAIPYAVPPDLHDRNGTLLWGHPDLDPPFAPPGWFASMQVNIV